jgi:hypothetical protein
MIPLMEEINYNITQIFQMSQITQIRELILDPFK